MKLGTRKLLAPILTPRGRIVFVAAVVLAAICLALSVRASSSGLKTIMSTGGETHFGARALEVRR